MLFRQIFEPKLAQYSYLIGCQQNGQALVVDPMRDIDRYYRIAEEEDLRIVAAADTHIHADYLSGLRAFAEQGIKVYASGEGDEEWRFEWLLNSDYKYHLLRDGDRFSLGNLLFEAWHTPGHTVEHLTFKVTDKTSGETVMGILSGDFMFVNDVGRPDLLESAAGKKGVMESAARTLFDSITEFRKLPEYLQVWPGHGAGSACGKAMSAVPESTVGYELRFNPSIRAAETKEGFVTFILQGQPEPPLYFARVKYANRDGPPLLEELPRPERMSPEDFVKSGSREGAVIVDTRNRPAFMEGHLRDSLLSPLDKQFNTVAGCYVSEEESVYLVIEEQKLEEAVRDLVRIGLDRIDGFITPSDFEAFGEERLEFIDRIDFEQAGELVKREEFLVVDVRRASEYQEKHIEGAVNMAHTRLPEMLDELPRDQTLLVHCQVGIRSAVASALLQRKGFGVKWIDDKIENAPYLVSEKESA